MSPEKLSRRDFLKFTFTALGAAGLAACGLDTILPTPDPTATNTLEPTLTPTEMPTLTPSLTSTPELSPTPEIETITFTNGKGEQITMPYFEEFDPAITYVAENTKWNFNGAKDYVLTNFRSSLYASNYLDIFEGINGWVRAKYCIDGLPPLGSSINGGAKPFFSIYTNMLENKGTLGIFQNKNTDYVSIFVKMKIGTFRQNYFSPLVPTLHP
jgi:hypothetical protein